jgi:hypothetical protein
VNRLLVALGGVLMVAGVLWPDRECGFVDRGMVDAAVEKSRDCLHVFETSESP